MLNNLHLKFGSLNLVESCCENLTENCTTRCQTLYDFSSYFQNHKLDFVLDLHASSAMHGVFIQGNSYDSVYRYERHIVFPKMMKKACPDFSVDQSYYNADLEKEGTARRY